MSDTLRWNLYGDDHLTAMIDKLSHSVDRVARLIDRATALAQQMGRGFETAEKASDRLSGGLNRAGRAAETMAGRMTVADRISRTTTAGLDRTTGMLASAAGALRSYGFLVAAALSTGATAAGAFGIKTAAANETAAISFEVLLGSADKAKRFMGGLVKFAAETPFEMPQLRDAASRLLAVGLEAQRVIPLMTVLGDVTAGMGTGAVGIERSITALTQMRQKTKVTAEEMLQLTEAGIPAWQALAAELHTTVADAMARVTKRTVDADTMFQALEHRSGDALGRLSGMMKRQSTTLSGLWSTFKDNAGQALATFFEPMIPGMKRGLDVASRLLPTALGGLQRQGGRLGAIFKGSDVPDQLMTSLDRLGGKLLPAAERAWNRVLGAVADNREGLEKFGRFVSDVLIPVFGDEMVVTITAIGYAFEATITVLSRATDVITFFTSLFLANMKFILQSAVVAFGWVPGLGPKLKAAAAKFDEFSDHVMSKLNALDGRTVNVTVIEHTVENRSYRAGERATVSSPAPTLRRAAGGFAPADEVIEVHQQERIVLPRSGYVIPSTGRMPGAGAPDEFVAEAAINLDGERVWQGLLRFKKRTGKTSLALG